jgi:hypothetical protein
MQPDSLRPDIHKRTVGLGNQAFWVALGVLFGGFIADQAARQPDLEPYQLPIMFTGIWTGLMLGIFVGRQRWKRSADFQIECVDGYFEINDYESALACYTEALRIAPNNMLARFNRGTPLLKERMAMRQSRILMR